jgi:hypothetical protein
LGSSRDPDVAQQAVAASWHLISRASSYKQNALSNSADEENEMRLGAGGWLLAGSLVLVAQGALGADLAGWLRNFYAEYLVVKQCQEQAQLPPASSEAAKGAIAKIEAYYLKRDPHIDKAHLMKRAVADKDDGFRIATRNSDSDLRDYCRASLKELLDKADEVDPNGKGQ